MPDMVSQDEFNAMLARAGMDLEVVEVEDLRHAHAKLQAMLELLRTPPVELAAEPAFTFAVEELP